MDLDPQCRAVLQMMAEMKFPDFSEMPVESARALFDSFPKPATPTGVASVRDIDITTPAGVIPARIYEPRPARTRGAFVYFHGGGWVMGNRDTHDEICRRIAASSGTTTISVEYRLAPETPFPTPADDCYAATLWLASNAESLGFEPSRIAIGGESAGANLAATVSQMARDRGGPPLRLQVLICPITNCDLDTASYLEFAEGYFLTRRTMRWFWDNYIPDVVQRQHPYASPLLANNMAGLPPTFIITAEFDPLRDEGEAYAQGLERAAVDVTHVRYAGVFHGFVGFTSTIDKAQEALDEVGARLVTALSA